ncbi:recombinase family protein [Edaphobacter sp. 12200R-103]|uniref:recombinase family protein n=1 Tax=Edaphobacter sp. 12200R-103 TaxID=2703788 RepID=UPI00351AB9A2
MIVWQLDRLGRACVMSSNAGKCNSMHLLSASDTTTPTGRKLWQMIGVLAELARSLIVERTQAGMKEARRRGLQLGRRKETISCARRKGP